MATDDVGEKAGTTRLARWQGLTVGLMVLGYAGFYLCRSNLSATMPLIIDDLAKRGMDAGLGDGPGWAGQSRWGRSGYALGKFAAGEPDGPPGRAAELPDRHGRRGGLHVPSWRWGARCRSSRWPGSPTG